MNGFAVGNDDYKCKCSDHHHYQEQNNRSSFSPLEINLLPFFKPLFESLLYLIKNPQRKRGGGGKREGGKEEEGEGGRGERERRELFIVFVVETVTLPPTPSFFFLPMTFLFSGGDPGTRARFEHLMSLEWKRAESVLFRKT